MLDWALAGVLALVGVGDVLHGLTTSRWVGVLVTLCLFLPLGVRRRFPLSVLASVAGASLVLLLLLANPAVADPLGLEHFLAWLVVCYSTAAHTTGRRHVVAVGIAVSAGAIFTVDSLVSGQSRGNVLPGMLFCTVAWLVGRAIQRQELLVRVLRERAEQLERETQLRAQADVSSERTRIARELHDVVAHSVSVMVIQAQAGQRQLDVPEQVASTLGSIEGSGREALVELRRLVGMLRSDEQERMKGPQPGLGSLDALVAQVVDAGVPVTLHVEGQRVPLPAGVDLSAFRILQEALTNTIKHGGQTEAEIELCYGSTALEIEVLDRGCQTAVTTNGGGHGLIGMRERVTLLGGTLETGPREGGGYRVWARLPLKGEGAWSSES